VNQVPIMCDDLSCRDCEYRRRAYLTKAAIHHYAGRRHLAAQILKNASTYSVWLIDAAWYVKREGRVGV
jgi:hypothetical protein